jgi:phosphoglycerate dehydrogenase-like enzyme
VLDVLKEQPMPEESPLLARDNVVLTPHIAGLTEEAQIKTSILVAEVIRVLRGQPLIWMVSP